MKNKIFSTLLLMITLSVSVHAEEPSIKVTNFPLRIGDKIQIKVFMEDDLSGVYIVDAHGKINFPLLGEVETAGLTIDGLRRKLVEDLEKDYLVNPQLKVDYLEGISSSVSVLGEVNRPGNYVLSSGMTLLGLVSASGGFTQNAGITAKIMRRSEGGERKTIDVTIDKILKGELQDIPMKPEDSVFIDRKTEDTILAKPTVAILGQVNKASNFEYFPGITVTKVISQAQGFTRYADASKVKIIRTSEAGQKSSFEINMNAVTNGSLSDVPLEPGDIIFVPESTF